MARADGKADKPKPPTDYIRWLITGLGLLAVMVVIVIQFGMRTTISGAVVSQGVVAVEGRARSIEHLEGGIVEEVLVRDGDDVKAGDTLLRLEPTETEARLAIAETQLIEVLARQYRLEAERDGAESFEPPPLPEVALDAERVEQIISGQASLFEARKGARSGQVQQLRTRIDQLQQQVQGHEAARTANQKQLDILTEDLEQKRQLVESQLLRRSEVLALEREAADLEGRIAENAVSIAQTTDAISEVILQILQVDREFRETVIAEHRATSAEVNQLLEARRTHLDRLERAHIRAPADGLVHGLAFRTSGEVISPGARVMQIIPSGAELLVEVRISPSDVDQLYKSQPAVIRLSALSATTTPELNGSVQDISADRFEDTVTAAPYFRAFVTIPREERERLGDLELLPGMPAEVFIRTQERTPMSFLLKPLQDQMWRTWRES